MRVERVLRQVGGKGAARLADARPDIERDLGERLGVLGFELAIAEDDA